MNRIKWEIRRWHYLFSRWDDFRLGWRRRSALILDNVGCPMRLNRWQCRTRRSEWADWAALTEWLTEEKDEEYARLKDYYWDVEHGIIPEEEEAAGRCGWDSHDIEAQEINDRRESYGGTKSGYC